MLSRLEAMLAQHARKKRHKTNKKETTNKNAAKKPEPHATGGSPPGSLQGRRPFWGKVGPVMGAMLAHVGGCVASTGPCWADLGPMLPHLDSMLAHLKHMLSNFGPMLAQKNTKRKNHGKTNGFARFWQACWGHVGPALTLCWSILGLCWPILGLCWLVLGLCWPILGARLSHLGAMLARLEAMLAQHARRNASRRRKIQTQTHTSRKTPKPHATEGSPRVSPRFLPGSSQVDTFSRRGVGGRGGEPL